MQTTRIECRDAARFASGVLCVYLLVDSVASLFAQGSLTPPGPPSPTMKTLEQVEPRRPISSLPFVISQPGSYYLATNLADTLGTNGITVEADNVTIDLSGFTLSGSGGGVLNGSGIYTGISPRKNLTVRNGTIRGWGFAGIHGNLLSSGNFESLHVSENGLRGIVVGGNNLIRHCTVETNGGIGIYAEMNSVVIGCTAVSNAFYGIEVVASGVIEDCAALFNQDIGIVGGRASIVRGCSSRGNQSAGILVDTGSTVSDCAANTNGSTGFYPQGIHAEEYCSISRCTAVGNAAEGIFVLDGSAVEQCVAALNGTDGVKAGIGSTVRECTVRANGDDGIEVPNDCQVEKNNCTANGQSTTTGSGVHASVVGNRIEANTVLVNKRGFWIEGGANFIVRNTARFNATNYSIVAGNNVGPIVAAPASGAISGSTGGAGVGTTDPWANFSF